MPGTLQKRPKGTVCLSHPGLPGFNIHMKLLLIFLLSGPLMASPIKILKLRGKAVMTRDGQKTPMSKDSQLQWGDILHVGKKSLLQVHYADMKLTLGPMSVYKVQNEEFKSKIVKGKLIYGNALHVFEKKSKAKPTHIETINVAFGVRGTKLLAHVGNNKEEFEKQYEGKELPPLEDSAKFDVQKKDEVYSQACCITGEVQVITKTGANYNLKAGQVISFVGEAKQVKQFRLDVKEVIKSLPLYGLDQSAL